MHSPLQSPLQPVMRSPLEFRRRGVGFNPASLFAGGEQGLVYDFIDKAKLFQDSEATTPVTADAQPIGYATDLSGNSHHGTQASGSERPLYYADSGAVADGSKWLTAGNLDLTATKKLTVIACVQTSSTATQDLFNHGGFGTGDTAITLSSALGGVWQSQFTWSYAHNSRAVSGPGFIVITTQFAIDALTALAAAATRVNGEAYGAAVDSDGNPPGVGFFPSKTCKIMTGYHAAGLIGKLARIIVIGRALSVAELFAAEQWAGQGGGVTIIPEIAPDGPAYYNLLDSYGQSLSTGSYGTPILSSSTRFNDKMFTSGVHVTANGWDYSTLIPLVESTATESATPEGETPVSGMAEMIHERGGADPFIGVTNGFPTLTISQLSKGQTSYNNFLTSVTQAWRRSKESGKQFKVRAFPWMQGESDTGNASYAANLNTLRGDLSTDIKAITLQTEEVWCLSYQLNLPRIGLAFLDASDNNAYTRVAMPMYFIEHYVDGVHLTNTGSKIAGAYFGLAYKAIILDGNTSWQPLKCVSSSRASTTVDLVFNPVGSLAFDTTIVAAQTNQGFSLFQADGITPMTITGVALQSANTVRITASATIPTGAVLRYGFADPVGELHAYGNLRDSQGDSIVFDGGGLNYPMHNWCLLFQRTIS